MKLAEDAQKAGRIEEAVNHARLAAGFDDALKPKVDKILLDGERAKAAAMMKRVHQILQSPLDMKDLADELNRVADGAADIAQTTSDAQLLTDTARVMVTLRRFQRAARLAQQATEVDKANPRAWELLAEAAFADGKWAILTKAAERWAALEPTSARAKELQKEARRRG
jgi:hypothetical protein